METGLILVGIDFSDPAAVAVERAKELAHAGPGRLVALHAADREGWSWNPEALRWTAAVGLEPDQVVIRTGTPWLQLARYADEVRPMMVVVGSHGTGGFQPVATGSTTSMLLTRVRVPVLVVPPHRPAAAAAPTPAVLSNDDPWRDLATRTAP